MVSLEKADWLWKGQDDGGVKFSVGNLGCLSTETLGDWKNEKESLNCDHEPQTCPLFFSSHVKWIRGFLEGAWLWRTCRKHPAPVQRPAESQGPFPAALFVQDSAPRADHAWQITGREAGLCCLPQPFTADPNQPREQRKEQFATPQAGLAQSVCCPAAHGLSDLLNWTSSIPFFFLCDWCLLETLPWEVTLSNEQRSHLFVCWLPAPSHWGCCFTIVWECVGCLVTLGG